LSIGAEILKNLPLDFLDISRVAILFFGIRISSLRSLREIHLAGARWRNFATVAVPQSRYAEFATVDNFDFHGDSIDNPKQRRNNEQ